nr:FAD-dependent oxidoreductase [Amylibacter sp.]
MAQKILIIGAGIIGSMLAWRLAETGCKVTLIDPSDSGGTASAVSLGWTNATYENPRFYYDLRLFSMSRWDAIKAAHPDLPYTRNGTLYTSFYGIPLETVFAEHSAWGYPFQWADTAELHSLEPNLATYPERGLLCDIEGHVAPHFAARFFRAQAIKSGAEFIKTRATALIRQGETITGAATDQGPITADTTLLAAGTETANLAGTVDINVPLTAPAGLLIHTKPAPRLISRTILTEDLHMAQWPDGSISAGGDFGGGAVNDDPVTGSEILFERLQNTLRFDQPLAFSHHTLGLRPTPKDGFPIIGSPTKGLYLTVMHSGATLAPAVGELVATELTTGQRDALLTPFHPDRFATT